MAKKKGSKKIKGISELKKRNLEKLQDAFDAFEINKQDFLKKKAKPISIALLYKYFALYLLGIILIFISVFILNTIDLNLENQSIENLSSIIMLSGSSLMFGLFIILITASFFFMINKNEMWFVQFVVHFLTQIFSSIAFFLGLISSIFNQKIILPNQEVYNYSIMISGLISLILSSFFIGYFFSSLFKSKDFKMIKPEKKDLIKFRYIDKDGDIFSALFFYSPQKIALYYTIVMSYLSMLIVIIVIILSIIFSLIIIFLIGIIIESMVFLIVFITAIIHFFLRKKASREFIFDKKSEKISVYTLISHTIRSNLVEKPLTNLTHIESKETHSYDDPSMVIYRIKLKFNKGKSLKCLKTDKKNEGQQFGIFLSKFLHIKLINQKKTSKFLGADPLFAT